MKLNKQAVLVALKKAQADQQAQAKTLEAERRTEAIRSTESQVAYLKKQIAEHELRLAQLKDKTKPYRNPWAHEARYDELSRIIRLVEMAEGDTITISGALREVERYL